MKIDWDFNSWQTRALAITAAIVAMYIIMSFLYRIAATDDVDLLEHELVRHNEVDESLLNSTRDRKAHVLAWPIHIVTMLRAGKTHKS